MENLTLELLALLIIKHYIVDFLLQFKYQWSNKGTLGHPGGILHSGLHAIATYMCLSWPTELHSVSGILIVGLALGDGIIHYLVDWSKMNINILTGWKPDTHKAFWDLMGLDQLIHYFTYLGIIKIIVDFLKN